MHAPGSGVSGWTRLHDHPQQYLQFVFSLATRGQREAKRWLVAFDRAQLHLNQGNAEPSLLFNTLAADAEGALFPKLAELPLQEAALHFADR